jgi:hypothetical protein
MKRDLMLSCRYSLVVLIITLLTAAPVLSAPEDNKKSAASPASKVIPGPQDEKSVPGPNVPDGSNKGGPNVKKKVVKSAGTAAAVGVAGKKITSGK